MIGAPRSVGAFRIASALAAILLPAAGKAENSLFQRGEPVQAVAAQTFGMAA